MPVLSTVSRLQAPLQGSEKLRLRLPVGPPRPGQLIMTQHGPESTLWRIDAIHSSPDGAVNEVTLVPVFL
ncbi:MAG: hypothetical protein ABIX37_05945 [Gammaproteobacteria bacterium]